MIRPAGRDRSAADYFPKGKLSLGKLEAAAAACKGCDLYKHATQTVFGQGARDARIMLVGEKPGNEEDKEGRPFVGPAGNILKRAMQEAGINPLKCYITNVVKHFKFIPRGKRRIHARPDAREIAACQPWLEAEIALVKPDVLIALGATAAQTLYGREFRVTQQHGRIFASDWSDKSMGTLHPSAILRAPDSKTRHAMYESFLDDLRIAADALTRRSG